MNNMFKISFNTKQELLKCYIRHFKHGGIFIAGNFPNNLNDDGFVVIKLPDVIDPIAAAGKIQWISPISSVNYPAGIGIHFNADKAGRDVRSKIELLLVDVAHLPEVEYVVF
jgi:Tfp pilus assembly protein PilZ